MSTERDTPVMDEGDVANERIAAIVADRNALLAECEAWRLAALNTSICVAGTDLSTPEKYTVAQAAAITAKLDELIALKAAFLRGLLACGLVIADSPVERAVVLAQKALEKQ